MAIDYEQPKVMLCTLDFETYWSVTHSLTKMNPITYIMHPETEIQSVSIAYDDWPAETFFGEERIRQVFAKIDWSTKILNAHNNLGFDALIAVWRFGIRPKSFTCTLAMSFPFFGLTCGVSLAAVSRELKLPDKGSLDEVNTKGKKVADFTDDERKKMVVYNNRDTDNCRSIWKELAPKLPRIEHKLIDLTTRMTVYPQLIVDRPLLVKALETEIQRKKDALQELAVVCGVWQDGMDMDEAVEAMRGIVMSQPKFANLLERLGAVIPMKESPTQEDENGDPVMVPALSKKDKGMTDLLESDDMLIAMAAATRLETKSTQLETRLKTFIDVSDALGGWLPMPLNYCGATISWRMSGSMKMNCMTGDHEVLTCHGWKRLDEWQAGEPIMQWWPDGKLTYALNPGKVVQQADELICIDAPFVRGNFTPEHRFVSLRDGRVIERTAGWVAEHSGLDGIPTGGMYENGWASTLTPWQVRLLVAVAADGSYKNGAYVFGFKKERKVQRLETILSTLQIRCTRCVYDDLTVIRIGKFDAPEWMQKGFGAWVLDLSAQSMDALLDEVVHWDGHHNSNSGQPTFFTTQMDQAEWVATIAHLRGMRASIYSYKRKDGYADAIHVYFGSSETTSIDTKRQVKVMKEKTTVYCPQVESSYVLVRYDGAIHVTGNCQNLPRVNPKSPKPTDALRQSILAPEGHQILVVDSSNIELRVAHMLAGQHETIEKLRNGEDLYCWFASDLYGKDVTKKDIGERFIGKVAMLSLQYGAGWKAFKDMCRVVGKSMGLPDDICILSDDEAKRIVNVWRRQFPMIADKHDGIWKKCDKAIVAMFEGRELVIDKCGLCYTEKNRIVTPDGHWLQYPELRQNLNSSTKKWEWLYGEGRHKSRIYGPHLFENICQHIARLVVMEQTIKLDKHYPVALSCHDEAVAVPPDIEAQKALKLALEIFHTPPKWWPDLPIAAEADLGISYAAAK